MTSPSEPQRPLYAMGLRLLAALAITTMFALAKALQKQGVSLVEAMFYRQLFALPVVLATMLITTGRIRIATPRIGRHVSRTALGLCGMAFNFLSVSLLPLAESITLTFTAPIFATMLSALMLGEKTGIHRWSAIMVGFLGVALIAGPGGNQLPVLGLIVGACSALSVALVSVVLRDIARTEPSAVIVFWFSLLSLPPTGLALIWFGQWHSPELWAGIVLLGLLGGVGQMLLTGALKWAPVAVVMPMDYSSILWAALIGWLVWGTLPDASSWAGASLIIGGGLYIVWREQWLGRRPSFAARASGDIAT